MAFASTQVALSATAAPLWAFETDTANNPISGSIQDSIPISVYCASDIYVGGPGVTTSNGYLVKGSTTLSMTVFGDSEILYAVTADGGDHTAYVLMGRQ